MAQQIQLLGIQIPLTSAIILATSVGSIVALLGYFLFARTSRPAPKAKSNRSSNEKRRVPTKSSPKKRETSAIRQTEDASQAKKTPVKPAKKQSDSSKSSKSSSSKATTGSAKSPATTKTQTPKPPAKKVAAKSQAAPRASVDDGEWITVAKKKKTSSAKKATPEVEVKPTGKTSSTASRSYRKRV